MATIKKAKDGTTVRKTLSGGTRTRTVSGNTVNITKTDKAGNVIKNRTRNRIMQDVEGDPSESSGSFARKGAIVKKKMAVGGTSSLTDKKDRLDKREQRAYDKYSTARSEGSNRTDKLLDRFLKIQAKNIKNNKNVPVIQGPGKPKNFTVDYGKQKRGGTLKRK